VHVTYNEGSSWLSPNVLLYIPAYADVTEISFTPPSTRIFAATPNNSLYSNGVAELPTGIRELKSIIGNFTVSPNPASDYLTLDFTDVKAAVKVSRYTTSLDN
jgi:hypothetical protein